MRLLKYNISVEQWTLLRVLYSSNGLSLVEIAQIIGVDKSSISRMIERLVQRGFVLRNDGKDRRSVNVSLTNGGKSLVLKLTKLADENEATFFKSLSEDKRHNLINTIKSLLKENGWDYKSYELDKNE
jgi:DNA-binding MarR family transcriptional regulator